MCYEIKSTELFVTDSYSDSGIARVLGKTGERIKVKTKLV